jgi:DNA-binding transcriptional ArsR family regulator
LALIIDLGLSGVGGVRLTTDAVWETVASMHVLNFPDRHAVHARLRQRIPARPRADLTFLLGLTAHHGWFPDTLSPEPTVDPPTPVEQFEMLGDTDIEAIAAEDIAYHSRRMSREGMARTLDGVHEAISYDSGVLTVDFHQTDLRVQPSPAGVWLVPSAFRWPWIAARHDGPVVLSYAARGAARVWESDPSASVDDALAALLGRSRAAILQILNVPRSTTRVAQDLRLSAGTVSEHLSVMTASGLLTTRREGRRVLYRQTPLGADLANGDPRAWSAAGSTSA